jgi:hypothetical protein
MPNGANINGATSEWRTTERRATEQRGIAIAPTERPSLYRGDCDSSLRSE